MGRLGGRCLPSPPPLARAFVLSYTDDEGKNGDFKEETSTSLRSKKKIIIARLILFHVCYHLVLYGYDLFADSWWVVIWLLSLWAKFATVRPSCIYFLPSHSFGP